MWVDLFRHLGGAVDIYPLVTMATSREDLNKKYLTQKLAVSLRRKKSQCDRVPRISKLSRWLETVFDVSRMMEDLGLHDSSNYRQAP